MNAPLPATVTPDWLARQMLTLAEFTWVDNVYDPCAGSGGIVRAAVQMGAMQVEALDLNLTRATLLAALPHVTARRGDMSLVRPMNPPTLVAMNPDFRDGKWQDMLTWGVRLLGAETKRLVSLVPTDWYAHLRGGPTGPSPEIAQCLERCQEYRVRNVPPETFAMAGAAVPTSILYVRLP